jgi:hypothetical protein
MSKCATCGTPVQRSTAAAIVWTDPPQMWCFACWDGGDTAVEQYRAAQVTVGEWEKWHAEGCWHRGFRGSRDGCPICLWFRLQELLAVFRANTAQAAPSSTDAASP